jgi:hypothetical protein
MATHPARGPGDRPRRRWRRLRDSVSWTPPTSTELLAALGGAVRALVHDVLGELDGGDLAEALALVRGRRERCVRGASRRARSAIEHDQESAADELEGEWLSYAALLVQVDRIVGDLSAPAPA